MLTCQKGNQLRRDLNIVVGGGKNWNIPTYWAVLLRYLSAPVLAIIFSFAYPEFYTLRYDPMMIAGFILAHICLVLAVLGFVLPRYCDILIPSHRRREGMEETFANEPRSEILVDITDECLRDGGENRIEDSSSTEKVSSEGKKL